MEPNSPDGKTPEQELSLLAQRVDKLDFHINQNSQSESKLFKAIGFFSTIVVAMFLGVQVYNAITLTNTTSRLEDRANALIDKTEAEISELVDKLAPERTWVSAVGNEEGKVSRSYAYITKFKNSDVDVYKITVGIPIRISIEGETIGEFIGYQYKFSDEFSEAFWDNSGKQQDYYVKDMAQGGYESTGSETVSVSEQAGIIVHLKRARNSLSCDELIETLKSITNRQFENAVQIKPIFKRINNQPREFAPISFEVINTSLFDCGHISSDVQADAEPQSNTEATQSPRE